MRNFLLILLLCLGNQIQVNLIGQISISDIIIVICAILYVFANKGLGIFSKDKELLYVTKLFALLVLVQIVTELIVGNSFNNSAKGIAVTVLTYLKFLFILGILLKNHKNILYLMTCLLIANIVFFRTNDMFGFGKLDVSTEEMATGEGIAMAYFKFKIAPLLIQVLVLLSLYFRRVNFSVVFIIVGAVCIALGARSDGGILFFAGIASIALRSKIKLSHRKIVIYSLIATAFLYWSYTKYVDAIISGKISGGNSEMQLKKTDNPYNPINLIFLGRTETFVGAIAFLNSPWTGWGAWAKDPDMRYHIIQYFIKDDMKKYNPKKISDQIPSHSVIIGYGVSNGIFAMLLIIMILFFFLRRGAISLKSKSIFVFLLLTIMFQLIWDSLFSPISTMRYNFAFDFAYLFYLYRVLQNPDIAKKYKFIT